VRRPTVRGGLAAAALTLALGLTACSGGATPPTPTGTGGTSAAPTGSAPSTTPTAVATATAADKAALASITVAGAAGAKPALTLPATPFAVGAAVARTVTAGTGDAVAQGDLVTLQILEVSGLNGGELGSTWSSGAPLVTVADPGSLFGQLYQELLTAHVGSRLMVAAPQSDSGLTMTVIDVVDVVAVRQVPARATGAAVTPPAGLPTVTLDATGKPSLTAATGTAPTSLVTQPLIKGTGPAVTSGQTVVVNYTGWLWDGTKFDSSWDRGTTFPVQNIGQAQVIDGWNQGLVGQTVGSQILLVVPPSLGYGANAQGSIPANSTLVFVVDILAAA
jgi:peptidylprolyl isomerase